MLLLSVIFGLVFGAFFQFGFLIAITTIWVAICIWSFFAREEEREFRAIVACVNGIATVLTMWVTYYFVTEQVFIGEFLRTYILR